MVELLSPATDARGLPITQHFLFTGNKPFSTLLSNNFSVFAAAFFPFSIESSANLNSQIFL